MRCENDVWTTSFTNKISTPKDVWKSLSILLQKALVQVLYSDDIHVGPVSHRYFVHSYGSHVSNQIVQYFYWTGKPKTLKLKTNGIPFNLFIKQVLHGNDIRVGPIDHHYNVHFYGSHVCNQTVQFIYWIGKPKTLKLKMNGIPFKTELVNPSVWPI